MLHQPQPVEDSQAQGVTDPLRPGALRARSDRSGSGAGLWRWVALVVGVLVIGGGAWYFSQSPKQTETVMLTYTVKPGSLKVSVFEQGTLESSDNTEIKCKVRGSNTIIWVVKGGSRVKKGDVLLRLDTLALDEAISERIKYVHLTRSSAERLKANVRAAELAIDEYLQGTYRTELMNLEKELTVAKSNLQKIRDLEKFTKNQAEKGFASQLDLEQLETSVSQSKQVVASKLREIEVLKKYTRAEQLETLKGNLAAAKAQYAAEAERVTADIARRDRALEELKHCTIYAPRDGLVIYPNAASWKPAPDIEEGATVHKDQVLLLMPDLEKMQVKVGVHESVVDRVREGQKARVALSRLDLDAKVSSVARVTKPAGWWTGNVVKYDTIIQLPKSEGLKPGMSAEVEIIIAEYDNVLTVPVSAVVQTEANSYCWVKTNGRIEQRVVRLGDSNDIHVIVQDGLLEGDQVVLNPLDHIEQAQADVLKPAVKNLKTDSGKSSGTATQKAKKESKKEAKKEPKVKPEPKSATRPVSALDYRAVVLPGVLSGSYLLVKGIERFDLAERSARNRFGI